jgi:hypothetical protein
MDRQIALANQYHNRAETRSGTLSSFHGNPDLIGQHVRRFKRGSRPSYWTDELESTWKERIEAEGDVALGDLFRTEYRAQLQIVGFDNIHFQYERGFIDEDFWQNTRNKMKLIRSRIYARDLTQKIIKNML